MFGTKRTYLDFAAGAPVRPEAARAYAAAAHLYGNPSSPHDEGRKARAVLEDARARIARLVECKSDDVVFTSGATEANNIAIQGVLRAALAEGKKPHALYLPSSHASTVETMQAMAREGVEVEPLPVMHGRVDIEQLNKLIRPETVLISLDAVCGETGTIWNTREVRQAAPDALLHVDASQAPLSEKLHRAHFGADLVTFDASKVGGERGIGCLIAARTLPIAPLMQGGGQERGMRPGSESPALARAFAEALEVCARERESFIARAVQDRAGLLKVLEGVSGLHINEGRETAHHILNLSLTGRDTDYVAALLDDGGLTPGKRSFAVSTKSACETDSEHGSRAVLTLTGDAERARTTLRISWGQSTKSRDIAAFSQALLAVLHFVDSAQTRTHH